MPSRIEASNIDIMNRVRADASYTYQQNVPWADQGDIQNAIQNIVSFRPTFNEFVHTLVNRIGQVYIRSKIWNNPLADFKKGMMNYGATIEELATTLISAERYDPNRQYLDLYKQNRPDVKANFHTINRQDLYPLTINEDMLRRAFLQENGLQDLVGRVMETPYTSDHWDEYKIMVNLFREYDNIDGFYKVNVPDISTATTTEEKEFKGREITESVRAQAGKMAFLSQEWNPAGVPTATTNDDLVLFATPEFIARLDVNVIAFAFNASATDLKQRIIPIDDFGIDGCQAILVDKEFFVCADTLLEFRSLENPKALSWNYFLHHHGIYSVSRFVNAIMFTTEAGSVTQIPTLEVTGVTVAVKPLRDGTIPTEVEKGGSIRLTHEVQGTVTPATSGYIIPQGVTYNLTADAGKIHKPDTWVDAEGVLHVSEYEENETLTVTVKTTYYDPTKPKDKQTYFEASVTINVAKDAEDPDPEPGD